ncbi:MAG: multiheme c-type cytochrome [Gemmatimonadota bacterium]
MTARPWWDRQPRSGRAWRAWMPVLVAAAALFTAVPAQAQRTPSRCVECHARLPDASNVGHGFAAWRSSRHAAAGVGCEACHGGNAAAGDAQLAHRGVVRSSDTASTLYFSRIPATCGRCHAAEAGYFRSSVHFARLRSDGHGPNCVTCHGAMATSVLTPELVLGTCSACHAPTGVASVGKSREAAQVLALVRAENVLFDVVATSAQRAGAGAARARTQLANAERHLSAAAEVWHSFRLDSAAVRLNSARAALVAAWVALGNPAPQETRVRRAPGPGRP